MIFLTQPGRTVLALEGLRHEFPKSEILEPEDLGGTCCLGWWAEGSIVCSCRLDGPYKHPV